MKLKLKPAKRLNAKIRMALQGVSGSGKTMSSLLIAYGLCGNWSKIGVIDTENQSADLYEHLGSYNTVGLSPPFTPEQYIDAIKLCEQSGMEVIIIDSLSQEWDYLLEYHSSLSGNSFTNWAKVTPRHNKFITAILQSASHVICTTRSKQEYVLSEKNGKTIPEKVGMKAMQRDGLEYEFTIVFDLAHNQKATVSKDRTGLFVGRPDEVLSQETGKLIADWCNSGSPASMEDVQDKIEAAVTIDELLSVYHAYPAFRKQLHSRFENKKKFIKQSFTSPAQLESANQ